MRPTATLVVVLIVTLPGTAGPCTGQSQAVSARRGPTTPIDATAPPALSHRRGVQPQAGSMAAWVHMGNTAGPARLPEPLLLGDDAPDVDKDLSMHMLCPGYDFGVILHSAGILAPEVLFRWNGVDLALHLRPDLLVNTFVVGVDQNGVGPLTLPLPRIAVGTILEFQALAFTFGGEVGTTNLLRGNAGLRRAVNVHALFPVVQSEIRSGTFWRNERERPIPFYINVAQAHFVRLLGSYAANGMGPVEVRTIGRNGPGLLITAIPPANQNKDFNVLFLTPPGRPDNPARLFFFNRTSSKASLTWQVRLAK